MPCAFTASHEDVANNTKSKIWIMRQKQQTLAQIHTQPPQITRRHIVRQLLSLGVGLIILPNLLTACENSTSDAPQTEIACNDISKWADEPTRQSTNYTTNSPHTDRNCANCQFFKMNKNDSSCGSCEVVKGPIAPEAFCNVWVLRQQ